MDFAPFHRGRRLRRTPGLRALVRENFLRAEDLVMPYFVAEAAQDFEKPIAAMPGISQLGLKKLENQVAQAMDHGLGAVLLFGIPKKKDAKGAGAWAADGAVQKAVTRLKDRFPGLTVITDVCLCEYTSHGHCGVIRTGDTVGRVVNDETLELLARTALSHVDAGADMVAPSDMMDGRIAAIRAALDTAGHAETPIMSYAVKHASAFYGPFREAAESAPAFGDRRTYQMDPANSREAMREAAADAFEGADILMVKPAGPCLDLIRLVRDNFDNPVAAYQVSGEYSMLKAAAGNGWTNEQATTLESLLAIKRAGADLIITYYAAQVLEWMNG